MNPFDAPIDFPEDVYADVRIERRAAARIVLRDGDVVEVVPTVSAGAFLRVLKDGRWYTASTTRFDRLSAILAELASGSSLDAGRIGDVQALLTPHVADVRQWTASIEDVAMTDKMALLRSYLPQLDRADVTSWDARYLDEHIEKRFRSSLGADVRSDYQSAGVAFSFTVTADERSHSERFYAGGADLDAIRGKHDALTSRIDRSLAFLTDAEPVEPGEYPVILAPDVAGVFAHESFGHKSEADTMLGDPAMLAAWPLGAEVGSPSLSIADGSRPGRGFVPYDDEGQPAETTWLIRNGRLTGRLHNSETAAELDEPLTGNARALDFRFEPIVRMTCTWIEPGDTPREELFAGVTDGFYVETFKHGSGMSRFTIAPSLAWRIRDGRVVGPARIAVITGNVMETLGEIDGLSEEIEIGWCPTGGCGKGEQWPLAVAFGGPYVRVARMTVA